MNPGNRMIVGLLGVALLLGVTMPVCADEALDKAFDALKTYDWGDNREALKPIDDAAVAAGKDAEAAKAIEAKLSAVLGEDIPQAAKDFVCRKLSLVGTAASVPALAKLLPDEKLSHMARYALERMPCDEALQAMREALGGTSGLVKVGIVNSLGARRDKAAVDELSSLLADSDKQVAAAAAAALGSIGTVEAAKSLEGFLGSAPEPLKNDAAHAYLLCADRLLADGNRMQALLIYRALAAADVPRHIKVAATRGMLSATGKQ